MGGHNAGADLDQLCEPADHTKVPLSPVYGLGIFLLLLMKQLRRRQLSRRAMDAVLFVRTKSVNLETSLREERRLVEAELRDIDTETVEVVSAIALDETSPQEEVELVCFIKRSHLYSSILQKYLHFFLKIV